MASFSQRTNPFYDRTCNNEVLKMQRVGMQGAGPIDQHLPSMVGVEYMLLTAQEPILYVIRKRQRHSPSQVTTLADYYIVAGVVYQAPDLASVLSSRLLSAVSHLQSAFEEARGYAKYHPSRGYWWDFSKSKSSNNSLNTQLANVGSTGNRDACVGSAATEDNSISSKKIKKSKKTKEKTADDREEPSSIFQRRRVDQLLDLWMRNFPPKVQGATVVTSTSASGNNANPNTSSGDIKTETEKGSESNQATQPIKNEAANTASPHSNADVSRGIKREGSFSQNQSRSQSEPKKAKPS
jgi:mediator of RNA polymerase II transcription subunit 6